MVTYDSQITVDCPDGQSTEVSIRLPTGPGVLHHAAVFPDSDSDEPSIPNSIHVGLELVTQQGERGRPIAEGYIASPGTRYPVAGPERYAKKQVLQATIRNNSGATVTMRLAFHAENAEEAA